MGYKGKALSGQRNHLNKFKKLYPNYATEILTEDNIEIAKDVLLWDNICNKEIEPQIEDLEFTTIASELLVNEEFNVDTFGLWMNVLKEKTGRKGKDLFHPIRLALTAEPNGPELKTLLPLIGYDKAYKRLRGQKA